VNTAANSAGTSHHLLLLLLLMLGCQLLHWAQVVTKQCYLQLLLLLMMTMRQACLPECWPQGQQQVYW
jgi:hypothetical protein